MRHNTILIKVGAGFIGSNFIVLKQNSSTKIINLDRYPYSGELSNLNKVSAYNYKFVKADIRNRNLNEK